MISIMELMEKKTPSTKRKDIKKGMTLVEVMAAMAILSILFIGISGFMLNTVKIENRAEELLESNNYMKSALLLFDKGIAKVQYYTEEKIIYFDDINQMQNKIINCDINTNGIYIMKILSEAKEGNIFRVIVTMEYNNSVNKKELYVIK